MKRHILIAALSIICLGCGKRTADPEKPPVAEPTPKALLLTETAGFRHESIEAGVTMFEQHKEKWKIVVDRATQSDVLTTENLKNYKMIVLLNTTGDIMTESEQTALQEFVRAGGAVLGIHAASDCEHDWPWYGEMIGGWFMDHPAIQQANCYVKLPEHMSVKNIPTPWTRTDEWYNFRNLQPTNKVVLSIDENSYEGGKHGKEHPISWYREHEGGRIFYTAMGHTNETYSEPLFVQHIGGAIEWLLMR